jgi:hypothetical protein
VELSGDISAFHDKIQFVERLFADRAIAIYLYFYLSYRMNRSIIASISFSGTGFWSPEFSRETLVNRQQWGDFLNIERTGSPIRTGRARCNRT